jgi:hypothetical protein
VNLVATFGGTSLRMTLLTSSIATSKLCLSPVVAGVQIFGRSLVLLQDAFVMAFTKKTSLAWLPPKPYEEWLAVP